MKKAHILLVLICLGITTFSMLQGSIFGAVLPSIAQDLNINWSLIGIMMSIYLMGNL